MQKSINIILMFFIISIGSARSQEMPDLKRDYLIDQIDMQEKYSWEMYSEMYNSMVKWEMIRDSLVVVKADSNKIKEAEFWIRHWQQRVNKWQPLVDYWKKQNNGPPMNEMTDDKLEKVLDEFYLLFPEE